MSKRNFLVLLVLILASCHTSTDRHNTNIPSDSASLSLKYAELPLGAIKPEGWLKHQLQIMLDGTTGHLDEVHEKIKIDNGWLGGKGDDWEETPYWLDGAVPLAYLLEDAVLKEKVLQYINWVLDNQRPSGYFGPISDAEREENIEITPDNCEKGEDWWPRMIMLKVLKQYYTTTEDERVIDFMSKYFNYQKASLSKCVLGTWTAWAESRGTDNVMIVQWLYGITKDASLLELASLLEEQSYAWSEWLGNRDWVIDAASQQNDQNWMHRHAVNVGMALKAPAIHFQRTHDLAYLNKMKTGFHDLMRLHGLPMGIFSGDEDLHGNDPVQGVELCAVTESMFSLEKMISITGDIEYMDALERMTFNVLPAQTTDDYNMKQYFQIANQVQISKGVFHFSLPFSRAMNNVLGMRSGYTCCLANMHQSWTKFTTHLWYGTDNHGIAALAYSPNTLTTKVGESETEVIIREETTYPFEDEIRFKFSADEKVDFPWHFRIPSWCQEAIISINGKEMRRETGGQIINISRSWQDGDIVTLKLSMDLKTSNWGRNTRTVERGPLVYALKLEERWEKGVDEIEGEYFSVYPQNEWNYGLLKSVVENPYEQLEVKLVKPVTNDFVWNLQNAPIEITAPVKKIPEWKIIEGVAPTPVTDRTGIYRGKVNNAIENITLVPFGCTKIRVVAFPVVPA